MWMYFLSCLLVNSLLTASENTATNPLLALAKASNVSTRKSLEGAASPSSNHQGYERDVLVVLPVMQGNLELTNSNLQMLYTKTPLTTIINEKSASEASGISKKSTIITKTYITSSATPITIPATTAPNTTKILLERSTISAPTLIKRNDYHHPYTEFLSTQTALKTQKSPLDYGYPESFKFVQELNDLPKNHKPEWAQSDIAEAESKKTIATENFSKKNPFLMFESVKPLEINKLLSLKPNIVSATESVEEIIVKRKEETTETTYPATKQSANKRPTKKPQKVKVNPQKPNNAEFTPFIPFITMPTEKTVTEFDFKSKVKDTQSSTMSNPPILTAAIHSSTHTPFIQPSGTKLDSDLCNTPRYSTLFDESTKVFLPTPYSPSLDETVVHPIQSQSKFVEPSSENWLSIISPLTVTTTAKTMTTKHTTEISASSSTTTSATFTPNFNWVNIKTPVFPITEFSTPPNVIPKVKSTDLISLTKILEEHFNKKHTFYALANNISQTTTTKSHFPADMLTEDMKNMLIALGLLKPEKDSLSPIITSTAAPSNTKWQFHESLYSQKEHLIPTIDPNSYVMFKKLPINYEKPQVSNDMQNLLSSFGLLPSSKSTHLGDNSILTRISRQQKLENSSMSMNSMDDKMQQTLKNLGLIKPMVYQMNRNRHIFQPSMHLEKLANSQQVEKINNALEIIRVLSTSNDARNISIEELERKLHDTTALLDEENTFDDISTDTPQLTTELLSTVKNLIFHNKGTPVAKVENSTSKSKASSTTTTVTPLQTNHKIHTSPTTLNSTGKTKTYSSFSIASSQSKRLGNNQVTTTPSNPFTFSTAPTINLITTSTSHFTVDFQTVAKAASAKTSTTSFTTTSTKSKSPISTSTKQMTISTKNELSIENSNSGDSTSTITPATMYLFPEEHSEINYTSDALFLSSDELPLSKNNIKLVMTPPPNPLSVEELQNLLETNQNDIKREQPRDVTTSSTTFSIVGEVILNNISSTIDTSNMSETSKNSSSSSTSKSSNDIASSESSSSNSDNSNNSNSSTDESPIKVDDLSNNNAPLEVLADSFGGENEEQVDNWQANAKPNGLYFLLDWNTFLSVGEEDKRPIRIQFSPRTGNPRNFMTITVP